MLRRFVCPLAPMAYRRSAAVIVNSAALTASASVHHPFFTVPCRSMTTSTRPCLAAKSATATPSAAAVDSFQQFEWKNPDKYISPFDVDCPLDVIILYNPSPHANNVAVDDLLKAWPKLRIVQTVVQDRAPVVGADHQIFIPKGAWGDMSVFKTCLEQYIIKHRYMRGLRIGFYPVWSSMAEDSSIARAVADMGLHWIGATPSSMDGLGKVEYKNFCKANSLPTADFFTISPDPATLPGKPGSEEYMDAACASMLETYFSCVKGTSIEGKNIFVKSEYGGGGRGTKKALPTRESIETAIRGVLSETKKVDGIYVEQALDLSGASLYQLEMEVDAGSIMDGGRLVYFNKRNQKMIELGFSSEEIVKFLPADVFAGCVHATSVIGRESKYNGRGTNEILIAKMPSGEWQYFCSEFNKRVQVEHKALSYLKRYRNGELFNTIADQVMRSCGYRPPVYNKDLLNSGGQAVAHIRFISPTITQDGEVSFPVGIEIDESILPKGFNVNALVHAGKLYADTDAQFGVALLRGENWEGLYHYLQQFSRQTVILGKNVRRDYFKFLQKFFADERVRDLSLGCNQTFDVLKNPSMPDGRRATVVNYLTNGISNTLVNGYRPDAGVKNRGYPTAQQIDEFKSLRDELLMTPVPPSSPFLNFLDHLDENRYFEEIRDRLGKMGGGMVSVFPRDVQQECGSSESHIITPLARTLMERVGWECGFIGQEQGGAQFQTAEMNHINSFKVLSEGILCNMPTFSLTRSHWMNALEKLNNEEVKFILKVTADTVMRRFKLTHGEKGEVVPYFPYNFHAGNVPEQDTVTGLMLDAGMIPLPNFVWDPRFTPADFESWVQRQLNLWRSKGRRLHALRIKNAGQQKEWTAPNVFQLVQSIRTLYKKEYGQDAEPVVHIHNHNFNGLASHVAYELLCLCQKNGFRHLVVDTAPPLMTHNNNLVVARALELNADALDKLHYYNESAHTIWRITERFHDFLQVRIDPDTVWAGGTGSSDLAAAEKLGIPRSEVEAAKLLGAKVSGLGGIVTPYSQWSMVIGYTCYKSNLKSLDAVTKHIEAGGTLNLPKNILNGLNDWKTLLKRPALVDKLLENHKAKDSSVFDSKPADANNTFDRASIENKIRAAIPEHAISDEAVARVLAYGDLGLKSMAAEDQGKDNNWLMRYPDIAYARRTPTGLTFAVKGIPVTFEGVSEERDSAVVTVSYKFEGRTVRVPTVDVAKEKSISKMIAKEVPFADPNDARHIGAFMPGVCESINVRVGQTIKQGDVLYSINSMKMVTAFKAGPEHAGKTVESIFATAGSELAFSGSGAAPLVILLK
eukprot:PhM_4_TR8177/c0_g1_i1/m.62783